MFCDVLFGKSFLFYFLFNSTYIHLSFMRIVKQNRFNNFGELHKKCTETGVKASRATTHRNVTEFGYSCNQRRLTWAKEKKNWTVAQWSKVLFSDEQVLYFIWKPRS